MDDTPSTAARAGAALGRAAGSAARGTRSAIRRNPTSNRVYRTTVGVVGGATVALGVALIPLPGPGSLIAVGGLALLGTEFDGAKKASGKANALARKALATDSESRKRRAARRAGRTSTP
jgi:Putative transmembrane protein (PGPGW)